ncbi:MAG TPA: hypothetical protein VN636_10235, partial [Acidimicrobiia bacterium]|nr:hypothetical protein [Acidimicrobiia bacterium]
GTDLWGGPAAKGLGTNARFDSTIYVSSLGAANGTVDLITNGATLATIPFTLASRGVAVLPTPAALDGMGAFLYHVRSDASVSAWSETYNDSPSGRYSVSFTAFPVSDFLNAGDEAWGGGADASTSTAPGRARTNVGVLCSPLGSQGCNVEWAAFDTTGALVGVGTLFAVPGSAVQQSLAVLVPTAAEFSKLSLRARVTSGSAAPYAVKNDNVSSDGAGIPLSVIRSAFSTAPSIATFSVSPTTGCSPLSAVATWTTTGADHVNVTGASGDLPPNGSTNITVVATGDVILTAVATSGATATSPRRVTVQPPTDPPFPTPKSATVSPGQTVIGSIPPVGTVGVSFDRQDSQGSTFLLNGTSWTYVAGTTTGTDIVRLTVQGACGPASATFTATVVIPGEPVVTSFIADPMRGCGASSNIVLSWTTQNVREVNIDPVPFPFALGANGSVGTTITGTTTFTLTAESITNPVNTATATLTVPVDTQIYVPLLSVTSVTVPIQSSPVDITVTGVPDPTLLRWVYVQNQSVSSFGSAGPPGAFRYFPGFRPGQDVVRIFFTNGCGPAYAEFHATVQ